MERPTDYCLSLADKLSEIIDGEAPDELVKEATGHVAECLWCRSQYEELVRLVLDCHQNRDVQAGPDCRRRLKTLFKKFTANQAT